MTFELWLKLVPSWMLIPPITILALGVIVCALMVFHWDTGRDLVKKAAAFRERHQLPDLSGVVRLGIAGNELRRRLFATVQEAPPETQTMMEEYTSLLERAWSMFDEMRGDWKFVKRVALFAFLTALPFIGYSIKLLVLGL